MLRKIISVLLITSYVQGVLAEPGLSTSHELLNLGKGAEFVSGNYPGAVLIRVNLLGSIQRSGIHHVPTRTDLLTLLALAGGPTADADLTEVVLKRKKRGREEVVPLNLEEIVKEPGNRGPELEPNDMVFVPAKTPLINPNVVTTVSLLSSVLAIVVTSVVLMKKSD